MEATPIDALGPVTPPSQDNVDLSRELGRDEFLKLLVAKLENQDPLQPTPDTEFIAELATFSSLEQLIDVNANLEGLTASQGELVNAQALTLIGKEALIESGNALRIKGGDPDTLVYVIPSQAREATLSIYDAQGELVRTFQLDGSSNGRVTLDWDGTDAEGNLLEDGDYRIETRATDPDGEPVPVVLFRSLLIDGVSFFEGSTSLVSGDREIPFDRILEIRAAAE